MRIREQVRQHRGAGGGQLLAAQHAAELCLHVKILGRLKHLGRLSRPNSRLRAQRFLGDDLVRLAFTMG